MEQRLLVERARQGDRAAFAQLVSLNRDAVYRAAFWVLKDPEEALDATQEAFLKAFRAIDRFEGRSSFRTWARTIATRVAIDRYGRRQRRRARTTPLEEEVVPDRREAADGQAERAERRRLVREAIESLPPAQRAAVLLRDVEGLSYEEIAESLGIPRGTVMSRLYYGRQNLKDKLVRVLGPAAGGAA